MAEKDERLKVLEVARKEAEQALESLDKFYDMIEKHDKLLMQFAREYIRARETLDTIILRTGEIYKRIEAGEE